MCCTFVLTHLLLASEPICYVMCSVYAKGRSTSSFLKKINKINKPCHPGKLAKTPFLQQMPRNSGK